MSLGSLEACYRLSVGILSGKQATRHFFKICIYYFQKKCGKKNGNICFKVEHLNRNSYTCFSGKSWERFEVFNQSLFSWIYYTSTLCLGLKYFLVHLNSLTHRWCRLYLIYLHNYLISDSGVKLIIVVKEILILI